MTLKMQIESEVYNIAERLIAGTTWEDSFVELKANWPQNVEDFARKIAGRANAARNHPMLWVIGLNERERRAETIDEIEIQNWWKSVESNFDGVSPELEHQFYVPFQGKKLAALYFKTDRPPYVFKTGDSKFSREIPWSEGTDLNSAQRHQILRLLTTLEETPEFEIFKINIGTRGELVVFCFLIVRSQVSCSVLKHKVSATMTWENEQVVVPLKSMAYEDHRGSVGVSVSKTSEFKFEFELPPRFNPQHKCDIGVQLKLEIPEHRLQIRSQNQAVPFVDPSWIYVANSTYPAPNTTSS